MLKNLILKNCKISITKDYTEKIFISFAILKLQN